MKTKQLDYKTRLVQNLLLGIRINKMVFSLKTRFMCSFFLLLLFNAAKANDIDGIEKVKKINRSYTVTSKNELSIENKYGTVEINTWDKNEFKIEITIKSIAESDANAQQQLDRVSIDESRTGDEIHFVTQISKMNSNWGNKGDKRSLEINYAVFMPKNNPLTIENKYGATKVPDFNGPLNISDSYGSFSGGNLRNATNTIAVKYGSATISSVNKGTLDIAYSSLKLQKAGDLTLSHRYGNLDLGDVDNLTANIDYSSAKINQVNTSGTITTKYCNGLKLLNIGKSLKNLTISSAYAGVVLGFEDNAAFDFSVNVSYGDFNYDKSKSSNVTEPGRNDEDDNNWKSSHLYSGKYGNGTSNGKIAISVKYGNVKFN